MYVVFDDMQIFFGDLTITETLLYCCVNSHPSTCESVIILTIVAPLN